MEVLQVKNDKDTSTPCGCQLQGLGTVPNVCRTTASRANPSRVARSPPIQTSATSCRAARVFILYRSFSAFLSPCPVCARHGCGYVCECHEGNLPVTRTLDMGG